VRGQARKGASTLLRAAFLFPRSWTLQLHRMLLGLDLHCEGVSLRFTLDRIPSPLLLVPGSALVGATRKKASEGILPEPSGGRRPFEGEASAEAPGSAMERREDSRTTP